jgi:hypothetical protein
MKTNSKKMITVLCEEATMKSGATSYRFKLGDRVFTKKYGIGTIEEVDILRAAFSNSSKDYAVAYRVLLDEPTFFERKSGEKKEIAIVACFESDLLAATELAKAIYGNE